MTYAYGDILVSSNNLSDHACARAHVKARRRPFTEAEVAAWRERIFANGIEDPVKVAVEEAVKDFGSQKDFTIWAWYANRIGADPYATERVFAALDYERDRRREKNRVDAALRRLGKKERAFARAVLRGKSWREMGLAKSTFSDRMKKVEKLLSRL